jgi:hypothetical protein
MGRRRVGLQQGEKLHQEGAGGERQEGEAQGAWQQQGWRRGGRHRPPAYPDSGRSG